MNKKISLWFFIMLIISTLQGAPEPQPTYQSVAQEVIATIKSRKPRFLKLAKLYQLQARAQGEELTHLTPIIQKMERQLSGMEWLMLKIVRNKMKTTLGIAGLIAAIVGMRKVKQWHDTKTPLPDLKKPVPRTAPTGRTEHEEASPAELTIKRVMQRTRAPHTATAHADDDDTGTALMEAALQLSRENPRRLMALAHQVELAQLAQREKSLSIVTHTAQAYRSTVDPTLSLAQVLINASGDGAPATRTILARIPLSLKLTLFDEAQDSFSPEALIPFLSYETDENLQTVIDWLPYHTVKKLVLVRMRDPRYSDSVRQSVRTKVEKRFPDLREVFAAADEVYTQNNPEMPREHHGNQDKMKEYFVRHKERLFPHFYSLLPLFNPSNQAYLEDLYERYEVKTIGVVFLLPDYSLVSLLSEEAEISHYSPAIQKKIITKIEKLPPVVTGKANGVTFLKPSIADKLERFRDQLPPDSELLERVNTLLAHHK